jgi:hypothetical protein
MRGAAAGQARGTKVTEVMEQDLVSFDGSDEEQSQVFSIWIFWEILEHFMKSLNSLIKEKMLWSESVKFIVFPIALFHERK